MKKQWLLGAALFVALLASIVLARTAYAPGYMVVSWEFQPYTYYPTSHYPTNFLYTGLEYTRNGRTWRLLGTKPFELTNTMLVPNTQPIENFRAFWHWTNVNPQFTN